MKDGPASYRQQIEETEEDDVELQYMLEGMAFPPDRAEFYADCINKYAPGQPRKEFVDWLYRKDVEWQGHVANCEKRDNAGDGMFSRLLGGGR